MEKTMPRAFTIEFDLLSGHHTTSKASIGELGLNPYGWRSIGNTNGARIYNASGGVLTAIYLKTNNPGDTFTVTPDSGGSLFLTIWLKNDNTEAYFMDAHIPVITDPTSYGSFWMKVPPSDADDLTRCDDCHNQQPTSGCIQSCPFTGQVFRSNPPDPPAASWKKVKGALNRMNDRWRSLMAACPSSFREIQIYFESPDKRHTIFVSNGDVLLYDDRAKDVAILETRHTELPTVNHVSFEDDAFVLFRNGVVIQKVRVHPDRAGFRKVGSLPGG
jgi:hypothetical protein